MFSRMLTMMQLSAAWTLMIMQSESHAARSWCNLKLYIHDDATWTLVMMQSSSSSALMTESQPARASSSTCSLSWPHHQRTDCLVVTGAWVIPRALLLWNWPSIVWHKKMLWRVASFFSCSLVVKLSEHSQAQEAVLTGRELSLAPSYCQINRELLGTGTCCHGSWVIPRALLLSNWWSIVRHRKQRSRVVSYPSPPLTVKLTEHC